MTNITYQFNIGVDIAKQKFDVSFSDQKIASYENNLAGFKRLLQEIKDKPQPRIVMEATGGYEKPLADFLQDQGVAVSIVNAKRVRDYAKALGLLAKNDVIDAKVIRMFADSVNPKLLPTASDTQQALDAQVHRRDQLVKQRALPVGEGIFRGSLMLMIKCSVFQLIHLLFQYNIKYVQNCW